MTLFPIEQVSARLLTQDGSQELHRATLVRSAEYVVWHYRLFRRSFTHVDDHEMDVSEYLEIDPRTDVYLLED